jgi:hypothetical protein
VTVGYSSGEMKAATGVPTCWRTTFGVAYAYYFMQRHAERAV